MLWTRSYQWLILGEPFMVNNGYLLFSTILDFEFLIFWRIKVRLIWIMEFSRNILSRDVNEIC